MVRGCPAGGNSIITEYKTCVIDGETIVVTKSSKKRIIRVEANIFIHTY